MTKNRSRVLFLVVSLAVMVPVVTGVLWSAALERRNEGGDSLFKYLAIFSEVFGLVRENYVDEPAPADLLAGAMEGVAEALDPFSAFVPAEAVAERDRARAVGRSRSGLIVVRDHGIAFVLAVEEGSPGAKAEIESGDIVAEIDGASTREMPLWDLDRRLAAATGSRLALRLLRQGDEKRVTLELAEYPAPAPRIERVSGLPLLRVPSFGADTAAAVRPLLEQLAAESAAKLLVDLRGVAGGRGEAGYEVAGLFVGGELGRLAGRDGAARREFRSEQAPLWTGEIAVLVDSATQGPAEVLAAALHGRGTAKLVGQTTFGWAGEGGTVELGGGGRLELTTAFYTAPDGAPLTKGVTPDLLVDDLARRFDEREKPTSELILERGIELLLGAEAERRAA